MIGFHDMHIKTPSKYSDKPSCAYIVFSVGCQEDLTRFWEIWYMYLNYHFCGFNDVHSPKMANILGFVFQNDVKYIIKYLYSDGMVTVEKYTDK